MPKRPPFCPKCGYNLQGVMAAWTEACPLQMQCSECGLEFRTSAWLKPRRMDLPVKAVRVNGCVFLAVFLAFGFGLLAAIAWISLPN